MSIKDITVVIATFRSGDKIKRCLNSIDKRCKVLVVENSDDTSFKKDLEKEYNNVECILAGANVGYGRANNIGLKKVTTKYVLILNPDSTLHPNTLDNFINVSKPLYPLTKPKNIRKVVICSGKIYFDLLDAREKAKVDDVVLIRIEQLYPFPVRSLTKAIKPYAEYAKFIWCQEEPKNMGAWFSVRDYIQWTLDNLEVKKKLKFIGRNPSASPATGYAKRHAKQQKEIIDKILE